MYRLIDCGRMVFQGVTSTAEDIAVVENEVWDRSLTMDRRILFEHIQELLEL